MNPDENRVIKELRDFFGIHSKPTITPEMQERLARIKARDRAVRAAKANRTKQVEKSKLPSGMFTGDSASGAIQMVSGDMYQTQQKRSRDAKANTGQIQLAGQWQDFHYYNITERGRTVVGTAAEVASWFAHNNDKVFTFNLELDKWDAAFDADNGMYQLTVEVGVADFTQEEKPRYLGGKSQVINEVVKNVGTVAGGMVGSGLSGQFNPNPGVSSELVHGTIDAVEGTAEQVAEHLPEKGKKAATVYSKNSAQANLKLKVEIYAGADMGMLKGEKFRMLHTWDKGDLETAQINAQGQESDRCYLAIDDVGDVVRDDLVPRLFRKMEVEGAIV